MARPRARFPHAGAFAPSLFCWALFLTPALDSAPRASTLSRPLSRFSLRCGGMNGIMSEMTKLGTTRGCSTAASRWTTWRHAHALPPPFPRLPPPFSRASFAFFCRRENSGPGLALSPPIIFSLPPFRSRPQSAGIDFAKLACLGRCNGLTVEEMHADEGDLESFRRAPPPHTTSLSPRLVVYPLPTSLPRARRFLPVRPIRDIPCLLSDKDNSRRGPLCSSARAASLLFFRLPGPPSGTPPWTRPTCSWSPTPGGASARPAGATTRPSGVTTKVIRSDPIRSNSIRLVQGLNRWMALRAFLLSSSISKTRGSPPFFLSFLTPYCSAPMHCPLFCSYLPLARLSFSPFPLWGSEGPRPFVGRGALQVPPALGAAHRTLGGDEGGGRRHGQEVCPGKHGERRGERSERDPPPFAQGGPRRFASTSLAVSFPPFSTPPPFCSLPFLSSSASRGFYLMRKAASDGRRAVLFTLACRDESWRVALKRSVLPHSALLAQPLVRSFARS